MSLLGLELSDAGILVAGSAKNGLLNVDDNHVESPGFALPEKNRLTVGAAAERKAHLYPRQVLNHFWDQLNTEPLEQPNPFARNHAEIAFEHFAHIWNSVRHHGQQMVIAVPGFYTPDHLGLILGITRELSISVKGFVPLPVVAVPARLPPGLVLHIDIHLHRFEITCLQRKGQLSQQESISSEGNGLCNLHRRWVDAIGEEFVRSTRFDPLHRAASEQELYDRLPGVLAQLNQSPGVPFEMTGGSKVYHVTLTRDVFYKKGAPVFEEIRRCIARLYERYGKDEPGPILLLSDRAGRQPGIKEMLVAIENCEIINLPPGAGALGIFGLSDQLFDQRGASSAPFLTALPQPAEDPFAHQIPAEQQTQNRQRPTHILYRNLAYPITEKPLIIGLAPVAAKPGIQIRGLTAGVSRKHCTVRLRGNDIVLHDHSTYGTFVNEKPVEDKSILSLGQVIRVGTPGEELKLIACVDTDET
jgi:FHA domain